jgi:hypothetical protein
MSVMPVRDVPARAGHDDYLFIDNVRFVSMIAIVMRHCELALFRDYHVSTLESAITQVRSFGVLLFFVNSGFLLAAWLVRPGATVGGYWRGRLTSVVKPWLIWAGVFQLIGLTKFFYFHDEKRTGSLAHEIWGNVFENNYWFVPILLFSLAIILPLRRYWGSWFFGVGLLLLSWFHGINQYGQWIPPSHTIAFFGYLFYVWLGMQLFRKFPTVRERIRQIPWPVILIILCGAIGLMVVEDEISISFGFPNYYNALQNSNQIYALVILVVLLKVPVKLAPSFIDVRKETYGIYLIHQNVGSVGRAVIDLAVGRSITGESFFTRLPELVENPFARIGIWFLWFIVVYPTSLLMTKWFRCTRWAWMVGEKKKEDSMDGIRIVAATV